MLDKIITALTALLPKQVKSVAQAMAANEGLIITLQTKLGFYAISILLSQCTMEKRAMMAKVILIPYQQFHS